MGFDITKKQELLKTWVEALRSGKYKQGRNQLRHGNSFCCLGVFCDIVNPEGWVEDENVSGYFFWKYKKGKNNSYIPCNLMKELGILDKNTGMLANMNDAGKTFEEIADKIENMRFFND